jgi:hypothetical protein
MSRPGLGKRNQLKYYLLTRNSIKWVSGCWAGEINDGTALCSVLDSVNGEFVGADIWIGAVAEKALDFERGGCSTGRQRIGGRWHSESTGREKREDSKELHIDVGW